MKKYLFIAGFAALVCAFAPSSANAQWPVPKALTTTAYGNALDTVDNTEQHVTTTAEGRVGTWKTGVTASCTVLKISGTVGGTLALQGSMSGAAGDWVTIGTATTPSDGSANYGFNTTTRYYYYRISWTGTGTMSASMKCYLFAY